ncbi:glycogen synthase GlgA [bacterium]|nr:glycogen synthase GlgA [bacterium]
MEQPLKIAFISSECVPFAKTGGLADVVGALPGVLKEMGHDPVVILPGYKGLKTGKKVVTQTFASVGVWMGNTLEWCAVDQTDMDGVTVYFIRCDKYFDREGFYHDEGFKDYGDNSYRFGFFSRAALQLLIDLRTPVDIIHCHDWQAALVPAYLKIWHWNNEILGKAASVMTIHNIAYQGVYSAQCYDYLGLQWNNFTADKFEDHGRVNFLKGGIQYADMITTVSPGYARETKTPEYAHGMAPYLNDCSDCYRGILNGVDYKVWNPEVDKLIPARFSVENMSGKGKCKSILQGRMGLERTPDIPLFGVVSRFADQKGLHLLAEILPSILDDMQVQVVVLGSGDPELESFFGSLSGKYPGRVGSYIGYSNELAHWIEAGCDGFIMPSLYEPCGLNQIYSLRYGTLPIVRATGGLDDTVDQYDEVTGSGTGFKFFEPSTLALYYTVGWAVSTWFDRPDHYRKMQEAAMKKCFSWDLSANEYVRTYYEAMTNKTKDEEVE